MSTKVKEVVKVVKLSVSQITALKAGYDLFKGSAKKTLKDGIKLAILMDKVRSKYFVTFKGMAEQTIRSKFGNYITDEIGISKTHRNLLLQIFDFDGMLKLISDGEINSISEAKRFMVDANRPEGETDANESDESEGSEGSEGETVSKELNKVLAILKQLDKMEINDKTIERRILANATKVLGVEVSREVTEIA